LDIGAHARDLRILPKYDIAYTSAECKVTVKGSNLSSGTRKTMRLNYVFKHVIPAILSFFVIVSLPYAMTNEFGNLFPLAEAQGSHSTIQNPNEVIRTFYIDGAIGSLVSDLLNPTTIRGEENVTTAAPPIYVLVGNWSMGVVNGEINYFQVDFIMGLQNGSQMQVYSIENLENVVIAPPAPSSASSPAEEAGSTSGQEFLSSLFMSSTNNYSLSLFGYVDITVNDMPQWQNVPVSINVFNGNIINILPYPSDTDNRFKGQPIYGIVTEILDANNNPIRPSIWDPAAA
jgi:hypothetical protein